MVKPPLPFCPAGTSFDSGAISNGFNTIDSGLYDNALISGPADSGGKSGQYDVSVKSAQYQTTLQSSHFGGSLASGQFDTGVKSAQYGASLKSGQYNTGTRSGHYDLGYKSAQYGSGVRAGQYDTLDAGPSTFTWSTPTMPSASTTVVTGNTSTYTYQASTNNAAGGSSPVSLTLPSSLSGESGGGGGGSLWTLWFLQLTPKAQLLLCSVYGFQNNLAPASGSVLTTSGANANANVGGMAALICFSQYFFNSCFYRVVVYAGYGVQKNMSYGSGIASTGVSTSQYPVARPGRNLEIHFFNGSLFIYFFV